MITIKFNKGNAMGVPGGKEVAVNKYAAHKYVTNEGASLVNKEDKKFIDEISEKLAKKAKK